MVRFWPVGTVRRFLEKWGGEIDAVVLCLSSQLNFVSYARILPLYCPRSLHEQVSCAQCLRSDGSTSLQRIAKRELPADTGNEMGETVLKEREIRINAAFGAAGALPSC